MDKVDSIFNAFLKCVDVSCIIEEESRKILWVNDTITASHPNAVGSPCWKTFFGKQKKCEFCPEINEGGFYSWEMYHKESGCWYKINNYRFSYEGISYRFGIASTINDPMRLNRDTVQDLSESQKLLEENKRIKSALEFEATHDSMTRLNNRNRYNLDIASGLYDGKGLGVLYFDLNNLKSVNDRYGHVAGDTLIIRLASAISKTAKEFPNATSYRIGGDEFILLFKAATTETLLQASESFQQHLKTLDNGKEIPCSVAIGKAYSREDCTPEQLISKADNAMYKEKKKIKKPSIRSK